MGYYTLHAIRIINKYNTKTNLKKLLRVIRIISDYSFYIKGSTITDFDDMDDDMGHKWYDCEKYMKAVSKLLPKLKIEICGKGESEGDEWCYIFKNGNQSNGGEIFIENEYDSDFNDESDSNHCSVISCSSSDEYNSDSSDD